MVRLLVFFDMSEVDSNFIQFYTDILSFSRKFCRVIKVKQLNKSLKVIDRVPFNLPSIPSLFFYSVSLFCFFIFRFHN
jgi:hypothetical protein